MSTDAGSIDSQVQSKIEPVRLKAAIGNLRGRYESSAPTGFEAARQSMSNGLWSG